MRLAQYFSLQKLPALLLLAIGIITPIFFIPSNLFPYQFSKVAFVTVALLLALALFALRTIRQGTLTIPASPVLYGLFAIPLAYIVSSLIHPHPLASLFGERLDQESGMFLLLMALLAGLTAIVVRGEKSFGVYFKGLFIVSGVVILFQILRLLFGSDFLSFGVFTEATGNLIGKWNDLGIYMGLVVLLSLVALLQGGLSKGHQLMALGTLIAALFMVATVNFINVLLVLAGVSFLVLLYGLLSPRLAGASSTGGLFTPGRRVKLALLGALFFISGLFAIQGQLGNTISAAFGVAQIEARPSWQSTLEVANVALTENPLFGTGPNSFSAMWNTHKPDGINATLFWNADFAQGVGFIPTSLVTAGVLGALAWLSFLGLLILAAVRFFFRAPGVPTGNPHTTLALTGSLYLWLFFFIYTPSTTLLILAFSLTGVALASLFSGRLLAGEKNVSLVGTYRGPLTVTAVSLTIVLAALGSLFILSRYSASILYQGGLLALAAGDVERGERLATRAASISGVDVNYRFATEASLSLLAQMSRATPTPTVEEQARFQAKLSETLSYGAKAVAADEDNYKNWLSLYRVYQALVPLGVAGAYDNARFTLDKAVERSPKNPELSLLYAQLELAHDANNTKAAREHITKALTKKGNYTAAIFLLAQLEVAEGNVSEAIRSLETATSLAPGDPVLHFALGFLRYGRGNTTGAIEALERAVALNENYANALYFLGLSYHKAKRTGDAIMSFEKVAASNPDNAEVAAILENLRAGRDPFLGGATTRPEKRNTPPILGE